jgi:hypothetical protein
MSNSERNVRLSSFPDVKVCVWGTSPLRHASKVCLRYVGTSDDLIAAGVATAEMLTAHTGRSRERLDPSGHRYYREKSYRRTGMQLVECYRMILFKPRAVALQMPGGAEAIDAEQAWQELADARPLAPSIPSLPERHLRLVVNNGA